MSKTDEQILAECEALDITYAQAEAFDLDRKTDEEESEEPFDPKEWGWVDRNGRP